jgi:hypothetical protein
MRVVLLILGLCSLAAYAQPPSASPSAESKPSSLTLDLIDGSQIIGTASVKVLKVITDYANLEIPIAKISEIEFTGSNGAVKVRLVKDDVLSGTLAESNISLKTIFGTQEIPVADIRSLMQKMSAVGAMPNGLVLRYRFDGADPESVRDLSGNGNDGRLVGGATYIGDEKFGKGLHLDGQAQGVIIQDAPSLRLNDFTIFAWIKRESADRVNAAIAPDGNANHDYGEILCYGHGGYGVGLNADGGLTLGKVWGPTDPLFGPAISDTALHQVAVTKRGAIVKFYVGGAMRMSSEYHAGFEFDTDLAVGTLPENLQYTFLGVIDEVAVFDHALSDQQIKNIYDSEK